MNIIKKMNPKDYNLNWSLVKQESFSFSFLFFQILLTQENISNKLSKSETRLNYEKRMNSRSAPKFFIVGQKGHILKKITSADFH